MYGTAEGFAEYHEARGRALLATWDDDYINAALLSASEWIDAVYGPSFVGYKTGGFEQEREWPRASAVVIVRHNTSHIAATQQNTTYVFDTDAIPDRVVNATYEAAWRHAVTPGSLLKDYTPGKYKNVSIDGALSVEFRQFDHSYEVQTQIGAVDTLLWPLLDMTSGSRNSSYSGGSSRI